MNITPLHNPDRERARARPRPVALVEPGMRCVLVHTESGSETFEGSRVRPALEGLAGHIVYTDQPVTRMRHTTDARMWTARVWKTSAASSMVLNGTKVTVKALRGALRGSADPYGDLLAFIAWCGHRGVNPASLQTMGWNLFRSTLEAPLTFASDPEVTAPAFYGGRQQARPRKYRHMVHYDIASAYPAAMCALPFPTRLVEESTPGPQVVEGPEADITVGVAQAVVGVPRDLPFALLPQRAEEAGDVTVWTNGLMRGVWPICELAAAARLGAFVDVKRAWTGRGYIEPFGPWWRLMREGRALPDTGAAQLAKICSNLLWGTFAMEGAISQWAWDTEHGTGNARVTSREEPRQLPHVTARHLAVETTARVRVRLLDALRELGVPPVHIDTDGVIVRRSATLPTPNQGGSGTWRLKQVMPSIDVRAPQVYRYTCASRCGFDHPRWHYVAAGRDPLAAEAHWERAVGEFSVPEESRFINLRRAPGVNVGGERRELGEMAHLVRRGRMEAALRDYEDQWVEDEAEA